MYYPTLEYLYSVPEALIWYCVVEDVFSFMQGLAWASRTKS